MKIDRLIGILSILLQKDKATAQELSEKFEVSRRTIMRDIEDINRAGIPIVTMPGKGGGVSIMQGYNINRALLSSEDLNSILIGLKGLDSISKTKRYRQLMEKISVSQSQTLSDNQFIIDLSGWDKSAVTNKIELIKSAIERREKISFQYFSPKGKSLRVIEPYHIVFQWSNWYVWGYCTKRDDYRIFKLTRMTDLKQTKEPCGNRDVPEYERSNSWSPENKIQALVRFDKSVKWRVIDEFGVDCLQYDENNNILLRNCWFDLPSFFQHILSFGECAEILEPEAYRQEFVEILEKMKNIY